MDIGEQILREVLQQWTSGSKFCERCRRNRGQRPNSARGFEQWWWWWRSGGGGGGGDGGGSVGGGGGGGGSGGFEHAVPIKNILVCERF